MQYTCGKWNQDTESIDEAQINKMNLLLKKLKLSQGMEILDIGGGFGTLASWLSEKADVFVTGKVTKGIF